MPANGNMGTSAMTEFENEKARRDDILHNRDRAQCVSGPGSHDECKLDCANHGVLVGEIAQLAAADGAEEAEQPSKDASPPESIAVAEQVDRPGFDLGGASGKTNAGKGLGLGNDARKDRKQWGLPRGKIGD